MAIERPQYRPTASPKDTVAVQTRLISNPAPVAPTRPLAPQMDQLPAPPVPLANNSYRVNGLLQALSGFSTSLNSFVNNQAEIGRKNDGTDAELRAIRDNVSSWGEAVQRDPSLADKSPYYRQVYEGRVAKTRVQNRSLQLAAEYLRDPIASSEDPTAISQWYADRMKETIDSAQTPMEREAMLEEVKRSGAAFINIHQRNALNNLVYKNNVSVGIALGASIDEVTVKGGTAAFKTADPVATDLTPTEAGILNAIAGGESGGKYNIRYDGGRGSTFELNGKHPGIKVQTAHGPSDAAGRYQFLSSTYKGVAGDTPFTPENQDKAALALAKRDYKKRTGRDLIADVETHGFTPAIQNALADTWVALRSDQGRHAATFNETKTRWSNGGGGAASGAYNASKQLHKIETEALAQGTSQEEVDRQSASSLIDAAIRNRDASILDLGDQKRPNGMPGVGMLPHYRPQFDKARHQIANLILTEQNQQAEYEKKQRELAGTRAKQVVVDSFIAQIEAGKPVNLSPQALSEINGIDPDVAKEAVALVNSFAGYQGSQDRDVENHWRYRANTGQVTQEELYDAAKSGEIKDPKLYADLAGLVRTGSKSALLSNPTVQTEIRNLAADAGTADAFGTFKEPAKASFISEAFTREVIAWEEANPGKTFTDLAKVLPDIKMSLMRTHFPDSEYVRIREAGGPIQLEKQNEEAAKAREEAKKARADNSGGFWDFLGFSSKKTTPEASLSPSAPSSEAARQQIKVASNVPPSPTIDWRETPVYESIDALNSDIANRTNPSSAVRQWMELERRKSGQLPSPELIQEFFQKQAALIKGYQGK